MTCRTVQHSVPALDIYKAVARCLCLQHGPTRALLNAKGGHVARFLLHFGADPRGDDSGALRAAATTGRLEVVRALLEAGADVHAKNDEALQTAAKHGYADIVELLLNHGANVRANSAAALHNASFHGHISVVRLLLSRGADVLSREKASLKWAARNGHSEILKILLEYTGPTFIAIESAAYWGHEEALDILLRKLPVRSPGVRLDQAIFWAMEHDHQGAVGLLLAKKVELLKIESDPDPMLPSSAGNRRKHHGG